jgi:hypothetical protein
VDFGGSESHRYVRPIPAVSRIRVSNSRRLDDNEIGRLRVNLLYVLAVVILVIVLLRLL